MFFHNIECVCVCAEKERHVRANARDYNDKFSYAVSRPQHHIRLTLTTSAD